VPLTISTPDGVVPSCRRSLTPELALELTGLDRQNLRGTFTTPPLPRGDYTLEFGPTQASVLQMIGIEQRTITTERYGRGPSCELPSAELCAASMSPIRLLARNLGAIDPPSIELDSVRNVRLPEWQGELEGVLLFVPPTTGVYSLHLGTPHVGLRVRAESEGSPLFPVCASRVLDDSCALRATQSFELRAGVRYRLEFLPPAGVNGFRLAISRDTQ
jgi:hypothetical protein